MIKVKKATVIGLVAVFIVMLSACGRDSESVNNVISVSKAPVSITEGPTSMPPTAVPTGVELTTTPMLTDDEKDIKAIEEKVAAGPMKMRDINSMDLVKEIMIGWNLGNTLDATGGEGVFTEMSWGNPKTTKNMIDLVKEAGFNTIRIPITWQPHLGKAPDYIIDEVWLDRVQEVVNYAYADDMFVIINMHHEDWYSPYYDTSDAAIDELKKVWKQIADRFENYDEHLIFEGMNEPRHKGKADEWTGGDEEGWDVINQLNAAFIETIRSSGSNNPLRHLMIPPYAASSSVRTWSKFEIPKDNKIIVSIHAYTPYNFALNISGTADWSVSNEADTRDIDYLMSTLNDSFISKGIPVILGEFGALDKDNLQARTTWAEYYVNKAHKIGVPCIYWDNNSFYGSGEKLGLLNRFKDEWQFPEIVEALMKGVKE
jgi:endoglucanase